MILVFCTDKRGGMLFNNRRPARDKKQAEDLLSSFGEANIYVTEYSAELFDGSERIKVCADLGSVDDENGICFYENTGFADNLDRFDGIVIYKWNLCYPYDVKFDTDLKEKGFNKISKTEFPGFLHTKITKETYKKINK